MVGALGAQSAPTMAAGATAPAPSSTLPRIRHVFVIMLENEDYAQTFGSPADDRYLATRPTAAPTPTSPPATAW
jgi:hypothetical protein